VPEVEFENGAALEERAVVVSAPDLTVTSSGDLGASPTAGAIASSGGEIVSRIEADVPAGLPPSIGRMPVILLLASILLLAVGPLRRWREVAGPA